MSSSMIDRLLSSLPRAIRGSPAETMLLDEIHACENLSTASQAELQQTAARLRQLHCTPQSWESQVVVVSAFAAVFEAVRRCHGLELFDVQLRAGLAIARGGIAEMQTGEGKTLVAALPAFLRSLAGRGVHVATPNQYLATRDFQLLSPVFEMLGATVGLLAENAPLEEKRRAYASDITYGTGYEFGFDYLREQLARLTRDAAPLGQRYQKLLLGKSNAGPEQIRRGFAIVDEVDSVLIDEACTPLILSDSPDERTALVRTYEQALRFAEILVAERDFVVDRSVAVRVSLTKHGRQRCYEALTGEAKAHLPGPWSDCVEQALVALYGLKRDVDYVVAGGRVVLVDGPTGRLCPDRSWRNGLQQLLELKEGVRLTPQRYTAARITRQRYFSIYEQLAGMTGTAADSADEFWKTYSLRVGVIPPRLPSRRLMLNDRVFADDQSRWRAVEADVSRIALTGRPLLIGCRTIERSEQLAGRLDRMGIAHQLLNGKQTAEEAAIIAQAGRRGRVTIATNMAGRGTDIKLAPGVAEMGGMHLIAIERNDSRRVDLQLAGRVGRQGDPGSCQFFLSADDALFQRFGADLCAQIRAMSGAHGEVEGDLYRQIRSVQKRAEDEAYRARRQLADADTWLVDELGELMR